MDQEKLFADDIYVTCTYTNKETGTKECHGCGAEVYIQHTVYDCLRTFNLRFDEIEGQKGNK